MVRKKFSLLFVFALFSSMLAFATPSGLGADEAYPILEDIFKTFTLEKNTLYTATDQDVEMLIQKASEIQINIMEILDCAYRYLSKNSFRIKILSSSIVRLTQTYRITHDVLAKILPLDKIEYIELGTCFSANQNPLDIYLFESFSSELDLGTAYIEKHFGFKKIKPLLFSEAFGLSVKVWGIKKELTRLELYEPGNGAFYVKRFFIPKRYHLHLIIIY